MRGTSFLVSVLVGGAGSWSEVLVARMATCLPSLTTNRSPVEVPQTQFIDSVMDIRGPRGFGSISHVFFVVVLPFTLGNLDPILRGPCIWGCATDDRTDCWKEKHSWVRHGVNLGSYRLLRAMVDLASAVFLLVRFPSGKRSRRWNSCAIWVCGTCVRHESQDNSESCATAFSGKVMHLFILNRFFWALDDLIVVGHRGLGVPESSGVLLPGDLAPRFWVLPICS